VRYSAVKITNRQILLVGLLITIMYGIALSLFLRNDAKGQYADTEIPDTVSYRAMVDAWRSEDFAPPAFRERVLLPALMCVGDSISTDKRFVAWLILPMHAIAVISMMHLTRRWATDDKPVLLVALLYLLFPAGYLFGPEQSTDFIHAALLMATLAATCFFVDRPTYPRLAWAAVGVMLCQLTRPSLFYVFPVILVLAFPLWCRPCREGRKTAMAGLLVASTLLVPAYWTISNRIHYGVATPSLQMVELLHRCVLPASKMLRDHDADPSQALTPLWHRYREVEARASTSYVDLHVYEKGPIPASFAENYRKVLGDAKNHIRANIAYVSKAIWLELNRQVLIPPGGKPSVPWLGVMYIHWYYKLLLVAGVLGFVIVLSRQRLHIAVALVMLVGLIMLPGALSWWGGARFRLPVDCILLVLASLALTTRHGLLALAALMMFGFAPVKFIHMPGYWIPLVMIPVSIYLFVTCRMAIHTASQDTRDA